MQKCYSVDDENFCYTEFSDVLDELYCSGDLQVGAVYYEANFERIDPTDIISTRNIIEDMDCCLYDLVGEAAEDGIDVDVEAENELEAILIDWLNRHSYISRYYTISGKSIEKKITEDDVKDFLEGCENV